MKNGVQGVVQQTAAAWGEPLDIVRIAGSRGTVWVKDGEIHFADATGSSILAAPPELALPALPPVSTDQRQNTAKWQMLTKVELPGYLRLCEAFRALIEGREPARAIRLPTFADGLACMEVLDAIRASAANGGALTTVRSV
jgi:predicted dehydrogenase